MKHIENVLRNIFNDPTYVIIDFLDFYDICIGGFYKQVVKYITSNQCDLNSGLSGACKGGNIDIVQLIIEEATKNNAKLDWNLGLHSACFGGHINIALLMTSYGANHWGLYDACKGGHIKMINFLIEGGINDWDWGLVGACSGNHIDIIYLMIDKGSNNWEWGLEHADSVEVVKIMLNHSGNTLDLTRSLLNSCLEGNIEIVRLLLSRGANWNEWKGKTYNKYNVNQFKIVNLIEGRNDPYVPPPIGYF